MPRQLFNNQKGGGSYKFLDLHAAGGERGHPSHLPDCGFDQGHLRRNQGWKALPRRMGPWNKMQGRHSEASDIVSAERWKMILLYMLFNPDNHALLLEGKVKFILTLNKCSNSQIKSNSQFSANLLPKRLGERGGW